MNRVPALCLSLLAVASAASTPAQTPPATFPSKVELVTVDVVVLDGKGQPVAGLARDDFVVEEDGRPQEIVSFEAFVAAAAEPAPGEPVARVLATNEVQRPRTGRAFAVVVDDNGLAIDEAVEARRAVARFLDRSLRAGDEVTLATTSGDAWWSARLPEGRDDLLAVAARVKGRSAGGTMSRDYMSDYEAFAIHNHGESAGARMVQRIVTRWTSANVCFPRDPACPSLALARASAVDGQRRLRTRAMLSTVRRTLEALAPVRGRKSLLLFSRGFLEEQGPEARDVAAASREASTAVYFVDIRGLVANPGHPSVADAGGAPAPGDVGAMMFEASTLESAGARTLADDTGGFSVRNTNDLAAGAERIAAESRVFYMLGFNAPPGKPPAAWRKLKVQVGREGLEVRARKGYTLRAGPSETERPGLAAEKTRKLPAAVERALDSVHEAGGIPLRAMAYVFEPRGKDNARVVVAAEFDASGLTFQGGGKARTARLEVTAAVTHRDTGKTTYSDERVEVRVPEGGSAGWRSVAREFELPAGVAQARLVVRDPASGSMGAVSQRFEIPPPGVLRVSTPIVTDQVVREGGGSGSGADRPRAAMAAHRTFPPAGALYCEFEVFGAARDPQEGMPRVSAGLEVRTAGGLTVRQAPPTPIAADRSLRVVRLAGLGLEAMAEGDYELVLTVRDDVGGGVLERREPFRIAR